jgi:Helix-turn-helix
MAELDITAADLARKAELSPATITGMLKGKTTPQRTNLRKLSGGLGWPHEHLWRVATSSTPQTPPGPHPLTALLSGPGFKDGAKLQSDLSPGRPGGILRDGPLQKACVSAVHRTAKRVGFQRKSRRQGV